MISFCGIRRAYQLPCEEFCANVGEWESPDNSWRTLPMPAPNSQELYGLFPVYTYADNYLALLVDGTTDYRVDWGDGNIEIVPAGTKAQHQYNFADAPAGTYYAKGDFRQVIVHVTMTGGGDMTAISLDEKHDDQISGNTPWLNINIDGPNLAGPSSTALKISGVTAMANLRRLGLYNLSSLTEFDQPICTDCVVLEKLEITGTTSLTSIDYIVDDYAYALKRWPLFDTSNVTSVGDFHAYPAVDVWPLYDFSNVTYYAFDDSYYTTTVIPAWDLGSVTSGYLYFDSVADINIVNLKIGFIIGDYCRIGRLGLVKLFNNLGTAIGAQTITLYCESAADLTPADIAIATGKGFTVVV